ncbi:MAG: aminodeoxychorismate synthase component I [Actinobacteria bacterium]|nr:aminodeoxychorismate synthase component I [Actinomycetota bacterium]
MRIISTITEVDLNLTPQDIAYQLKGSDYLCFLDSSLLPDKYSRFSYIGWDPAFVIKSRGLRNEFINTSKKIKNYSYHHPLKYFKKNLNDFIFHLEEDRKANIQILHIKNNTVSKITHSAKRTGSGMPDFIGGFMGYFSYDLKDHIEDLPRTTVDDINIPIIYQGYYNKVLARSHQKDQWYFIDNFIVCPSDGQGRSGSTFDDRIREIFGPGDLIDTETDHMKIRDRVEKDLGNLKSVLDENKGDIRTDIVSKYLKEDNISMGFKSNMTKKDYIGGVKRTKKYIYEGDIYQVNFSQRFQSEVQIDPMDMYYILRNKNAAPFSAYLGFPEFAVGCSSPERFLYQKGDIIETRPIKGTRPRGRDSLEDEKNAGELAESTKDRAELNMIVDLERNDLGKFCYYGTVEVEGHAVIEKYARVLHLVSTVTGRVKKGTDAADILKATFPGGSITGAPKIRAMEIIDELEPVSRGIYTGSIGYISIDGTMDLNIVIRTFIIKDGRFYYNVGGGIVADSDPLMEYQETLDKGIALKETLNFFRKKNLMVGKKNE